MIQYTFIIARCQEGNWSGKFSTSDYLQGMTKIYILKEWREIEVKTKIAASKRYWS